jgi:5-formyltetrahydrofolate cyclo-ligase
MTKLAARRIALQQREGCDPALGEKLAEHVLTKFCPPPGAVVAGFWPLPGEIDIRPLLFRLASAGQPIALPVTPRRGLALTFRRWAPGETLVAGRFGTLHPLGPEIVPEWCLVPLLAFDRAGHRLGYGGGYYDRTLAAYPQIVRLGIAFAAQQMAAVPVGPHDIRLSHVATERGIINCDVEGD